MNDPTLESVREKIDIYRRTRKNRRQRIPDSILADIQFLLKSHKKGELIRELGVSDAVFRRERAHKPSSIVRVAPIVVSDTAHLHVEVSLPGSQAARVSGLSSVAAVGVLMGGKRC